MEKKKQTWLDPLVGREPTIDGNYLGRIVGGRYDVSEGDKPVLYLKLRIDDVSRFDPQKLKI